MLDQDVLEEFRSGLHSRDIESDLELKEINIKEFSKELIEYLDKLYNDTHNIHIFCTREKVIHLLRKYHI